MKIYKKSQLNMPNIDAQEKAMQSLSEFTNMVKNFVAEQQNQKEQIAQKAEETSRAFENAGLDAEFMNHTMQSLENGDWSNIQNISSEFQSIKT